jgi:hypothetical protein
MSDVLRFLHSINHKYFENSPEKLKELQALWESFKEVKKCSTLIKSGKNKGLECGKKCVEDSDYCFLHKKEPEQKVKEPKKVKVKVEKENTCTFTMKSGTRKGQVCGKKCVDLYCASHSKKEPKEKEPKEKEPKEKVCGVEIVYGEHKGKSCTKKCVEGKDTCDSHEAIRVKKIDGLHFIRNTNVVFDIEKQVALGYKKDGIIINEMNDEVQEVCQRYQIEFL